MDKAASSSAIDRLVGDEDRLPLGWMVFLALVLHAGVAVGAAKSLDFAQFGDWMTGFRKHLRDRILQEYEVDVIKDEPPKPPEPEKEPEPEVKPEVAKVEPKEAPPAAPAAAAAARVLAAEPNPNEPVDMTGAFVQGNANTYTGGSTMAAGTATTMVTAVRPVATGVVGGTGTAAVASTVDKSRALRLRGGRDWQCPFPAEADVEQIDSASPVIDVSTRADGSIESVTVVSDPGHGFGREARACALRQGFDPALDRAGNPIPARKQFRVGFHR